MSSSPSKSTSNNPLQYVGTVVGLMIGYYAGFTLLVPLAIVGIIAFVGLKVSPDRKAQVILFALVAGHIGWMVLGSVLLRSWTAAIGDIALLAGSLLWYCLRPNRWSIGVLGVILALEFSYAVYGCFHVGNGTAMQKAYVVHAALYLTAIAQIIALQFGRTGNKTSNEPNPSQVAQPASPAGQEGQQP